MKRSAKTYAFVFCLLLPLSCKAQKLGQIECSRQEGYVYLYSSMATMEISTTLKCGQVVSVLDRSDNYVHVRTDAGDDGFVPLSNVLFVKPGAVVKCGVKGNVPSKISSAADRNSDRWSGLSTSGRTPSITCSVEPTRWECLC